MTYWARSTTWLVIGIAAMMPGFLPHLAAGEASSRLLLCGGDQVRVLQLESVGEKTRASLAWEWSPAESVDLPSKIVAKLKTLDDCKPSRDGKELLVSSSAGAVAIMTYPSGKPVFYAAVPNAHSIAVLPGGLVVAASSTSELGNKLMLFERSVPDKAIFTLPLPAAHGVEWDERRKALWALGDKALLQMSVSGSKGEMKVIHSYPIQGGGGHDLVLSPDGNSLIITTSARVLRFDILTETFSTYEPLAGLTGVKSISIHPMTGRLAYTKADPGTWWTHTVRLLNPQGDIPVAINLYKVRWAAPISQGKSNEE